MDTSQKDMLKGLVLGVGLGAVSAVVLSKLCGTPSDRSQATTKSVPSADSSKPATTTASTTNSGINADASAGNVYETSRAVDEYKLFHYGAGKDVLPYDCGPKNALDFPERTATMCIRLCEEKGLPLDRALDVGCAVGAASFHLASEFREVVGVDFSHAFVAAAKDVQTSGKAEFTAVMEAEISKPLSASVPSSIDRSRCSFEQGDACNLRKSLGKFSVIHASNLLCRLPDPRKFLESLDSFLVEGGLVVLISPYSWMPGYTDRSKWVGGFVDDGKAHYSRKGLLEIMEPSFKLVREDDVPFMIREHARKYQWGCSHATVFQKR